MSELRLFIPIGKVDEAARTVYGTLTEEIADKSGELFDYASGKPAVQAWSDEINVASKGKSKGNVRAMHGNVAAGKFTDIVYDDANKRIEGAAKIVDDSEWEKVLAGVYTGFSIGGAYTKRWQDPDNSSLWRFTPKLSEISLVDNPCVPTATFEYIKADGSRELRKFASCVDEDKNNLTINIKAIDSQAAADFLRANTHLIASAIGKFTPSHKEDSMDPKLLADAREALAKGTATDEQKALVTTADAELLKAAQDATGKGDATDEQKALAKAAADAEAAKIALVKDGKAVKPASEPEARWLSKRALEILEAAGALDEAPIKKRDAEIRNLILEKQSELAPALSQMDALLKAAKPAKDEDEDEDGDDEDTKKAKKSRRDEKTAKAKEQAEKDDAEMAAKAAADALNKKTYSEKERKEMAGKEAMDDGSFPIKTKKDVKDAVDDWGRAGSKADVKAHIMARAKAIGAESELPDGWTKKEKSAAGNLKKGLHQVGWLANLLGDLQSLQSCVEYEQMWEGDTGSELPGKFKVLVAEMCSVLVALVDEETKELIEDGVDTDVEIMEMAAGLPKDHAAALGKFVAEMKPYEESDLKKPQVKANVKKFIALKDALVKAGARHSKADMESFADLHKMVKDHADAMSKMADDHCDAMGKCMKDAGMISADDGEDDMEPSGKGAKKMSRVIDDLNAKSDELLAVTKLATTQNETLLEAIPLIKSLQGQIGALQQEKTELVKRMEHLEKQPAAPKGHVRAVSKTQDNGGAGGEAEAEYKARLEKMDPPERTRELMKLAMSNPQAMPAK